MSRRFRKADGMCEFDDEPCSNACSEGFCPSEPKCERCPHCGKVCSTVPDEGLNGYTELEMHMAIHDEPTKEVMLPKVGRMVAKICAVCGNYNPPEATFCCKCGAGGE
jgi:hypothetical protein